MLFPLLSFLLCIAFIVNTLLINDETVSSTLTVTKEVHDCSLIVMVTRKMFLKKLVVFV